jgi:putative two-component system response regulator
VGRVLIIDDDPHVARLLQVALQGEHEVLVAGGGEEGLRLAAAEHPDIVVLDVLMPGMDGYSVLDQLKAGPATREMAVIMLTAKAATEDVRWAAAIGADYYLAKPFNPHDVAALIRRHLATPP